MSSSILELKGVHTHIGQYHILHGVNFALPKGQTTVLLGRNGAGKTTTLRTIMGLWKPSRGEIRFKGGEIAGQETDSIARAGLAYVPENMGIFRGLTVRENLLLAARQGPFAQPRLEWLIELFPHLRKFWDLPAGKLSGGQKQMLSIARALIEPRELLLIDEPTKGLAPVIIENMIAAFLELRRTQTSILLVEQNFAFASALGDHALVMDDGKIVYAGPMTALTADKELQESLLGLALDAHQ